MQRRFCQIDVFSDTPFGGNPLAVVVDGDGLTAEQMQQFTHWTNLSEAAFLLPVTNSDADYRVRIFAQSGELPFAGHPTLGSCHAWLESGGSASSQSIVQECGAGLVHLRETPEGLAFQAPPLIRHGAVSDQELAHVVHTLDIAADQVLDASWTDNGPGWVSVLLGSAEEVLALRPRAVVEHPTHIGVVGPYPAGAPQAVEIRAFGADQHLTLREDPVTGSLNAAVAQWLLNTGRIEAPYTASQGTKLDRRGRPHITVQNGGVWVAGRTTTHVRGHVQL